MRFYDKNVEKAFRTHDVTPIENLEVRDDSNISGYRTKTIKSGDRVVEFELFPIPDPKKRKNIEKIIREYDPEKRKMYHEKATAKNLQRLLIENCDTSWMWMTCDYRDGVEPKDEAELKKDMKLLVRRLQGHISRHGGRKLKWVAIPHGGSGTRYHFHFICNFEDMEVAESKWTKGTYPQTERLKIYPKRGLECMAKYVSGYGKNKQSFMKGSHMKSYLCSQGLKKPWLARKDGGRTTVSDSKVSKSTVEKIGTGRASVEEIFEKMKKGFRVLDREIKRSEHISGWYISVQMVKLE